MKLMEKEEAIHFNGYKSLYLYFLYDIVKL